jgi:hypothetical protein
MRQLAPAARGRGTTCDCQDALPIHLVENGMPIEARHIDEHLGKPDAAARGVDGSLDGG